MRQYGSKEVIARIKELSVEELLHVGIGVGVGKGRPRDRLKVIQTRRNFLGEERANLRGKNDSGRWRRIGPRSRGGRGHERDGNAVQRLKLVGWSFIEGGKEGERWGG